MPKDLRSRLLKNSPLCWGPPLSWHLTDVPLFPGLCCFWRYVSGFQIFVSLYVRCGFLWLLLKFFFVFGFQQFVVCLSMVFFDVYSGKCWYFCFSRWLVVLTQTKSPVSWMASHMLSYFICSCSAYSLHQALHGLGVSQRQSSFYTELGAPHLWLSPFWIFLLSF